MILQRSRLLVDFSIDSCNCMHVEWLVRGLASDQWLASHIPVRGFAPFISLSTRCIGLFSQLPHVRRKGAKGIISFSQTLAPVASTEKLLGNDD